VDLKHFRIDQSMEIESLDDINAITMTAENGAYALGCSKGLYIMKQLSINSKHFDYKNIVSIAYVGESTIILGIKLENKICTYDFDKKLTI
jgi:hypothetical protein